MRNEIKEVLVKHIGIPKDLEGYCGDYSEFYDDKEIEDIMADINNILNKFYIQGI